jgi:hypothetical protein
MQVGARNCNTEIVRPTPRNISWTDLLHFVQRSWRAVGSIFLSRDARYRKVMCFGMQTWLSAFGLTWNLIWIQVNNEARRVNSERRSIEQLENGITHFRNR